jgi:hypothetical protein
MTCCQLNHLNGFWWFQSYCGTISKFESRLLHANNVAKLNNFKHHFEQNDKSVPSDQSELGDS